MKADPGMIEPRTFRAKQLSSLKLHEGFAMGKPSISPKYEADMESYISAQRKVVLVLSQSSSVGEIANSNSWLPGGVVMFLFSWCYSEELSFSCEIWKIYHLLANKSEEAGVKPSPGAVFPISLLCPCLSPLIYMVGWEDDSPSSRRRKDSHLVRNTSALLTDIRWNPSGRQFGLCWSNFLAIS